MKWCARCSWGDTSTRHRLMHWHLRCGLCRRLRVFRGPCCTQCGEGIRALLADILKDTGRD